MIYFGTLAQSAWLWYITSMRLVLGPEFRAEWERYQLRFCCEDCAYWDRQETCCAHGWPEEEHRLAFYQNEGCRELVFCKEFELL